MKDLLAIFVLILCTFTFKSSNLNSISKAGYIDTCQHIKLELNYILVAHCMKIDASFSLTKIDLNETVKVYLENTKTK